MELQKTIRNEEVTRYYVDLANRDCSAHRKFIEVTSTSNCYIDWLRKHPEDTKLAIGAFGIDPEVCQLIVCRNADEHERALSMGDWQVTGFYESVEYKRIETVKLA